MLMGMSYEDYWDGDPEKAKYVKEAYLLYLDERNRSDWMVGRYVYEALLAAAPITRSFSTASAPRPYLEEAIPVTVREARRQEEERTRKEQERVQEMIREQIAEANRFRRERREKETTDERNV